MKRVIFMVCLLFPCIAYGAVGTVEVSQKRIMIADTHPREEIRQLTFTCVGSSTDGTIPDTTISSSDMNFIRGWCLKSVEAYPTNLLGVVPDDASVFILDPQGLDLLGSEDGSTTPYEGLDLIDNALKRKCIPNLYLYRAGLHMNYYVEVIVPLTLKVIDQDTNSALFTVVLTFVK